MDCVKTRSVHLYKKNCKLGLNQHAPGMTYIGSQIRYCQL